MAAAPVPADAGGPDPQQTAHGMPGRAVLEGGEAWTVTAGYADVFASPRGDRAGAGRRHHLFRATTGALLFGLPESPDVIVEAVGNDSTVLTPTTRETLEAQMRAPASRPTLRRNIDWWIDRLCEYIAGGMPPAGCVGHGAGQDVSLPEGGCVRPEAGVLAIEMLAGDAKVWGRELSLPEGSLIALSWRAWLQAEPGGMLRLTALPQIAERGDLWRAVDALHVIALAGVNGRLQETARSERKRYATRMASTIAASHAALGTLAASFLNVAAARTAPPTATAHDQLNAACLLVTARLGMPFVRPAATTFKNIKEGVENIARASNFRTRHVTLDDRWWRHEQGPLMGFVKGTNRAVALLPRSRGGYDLADPDGSPPRRVDRALAATLAPTAITFYRPFNPGPVDFWSLVHFAAFGCRRELVMIFLTGTLIGAIGMGIPIATGVLINTIIPATDRSQLTQWTLLLIVCTMATAGFNIARSLALIRLEMLLGYAIQAAVWDRLISLPARFFRDYSAGNLATRAMGIDAVRQTLSGSTIRGVLGGMFSIFNFALMFYYDVPLALAGTAVIAVAVTTLVSVAYLQRIQQHESVLIQAKKAGVMLQLLSGIRKLRVAGAEMRGFGLWCTLFSQQRVAKARISNLGTIWKMFATVLPLLSIGVLVTIVLMTSDGEAIKTGDFLAFMAAFSGCVSAILATAGAAIGALSIVPQYELAKPILTALPEISAGQADPGVLTGEIAVDRVVFGYQPDAPPILNDVTFRIKAGEFVAFVGPSGSGKSTILRLLLGFETPQSGAVSYDSRDFKDLDVRAVRRQIGVVLQSGRMMPGDIYTNIIGCSSATMEEAWAASRMAGFEEDLKRMPMGMHTMVTDGGGTLSGGQRQRLLIARAIVTQPRMLFFDEATSALDNQTQAIVSQSLERLRATRVIVAHRLSTIINADRIYVIEKGRIVQSGTYDELMAQPGTFQELASRQLA